MTVRCNSWLNGVWYFWIEAAVLGHVLSGLCCINILMPLNFQKFEFFIRKCAVGLFFYKKLLRNSNFLKNRKSTCMTSLSLTALPLYKLNIIVIMPASKTQCCTVFCHFESIPTMFKSLSDFSSHSARLMNEVLLLKTVSHPKRHVSGNKPNARRL